MKFVIISLLIGTLLVIPSFSAPSEDNVNSHALPNVKIDQPYAAFTENSTIFLTCEDNNNPASPLRWVRENNAPLPSNAIVIDGFLEIPSLGWDDVGIYTCETPDYPRSTPGQSDSIVVVILKPDPNRELERLD